MKQNSKRRSRVFNYLFLGFFALFVLLPILYTVTNSFMSASEINQYYGRMTQEGNHTIFHLLPDRISLDGYYQMLFRRPDYLVKFWNSIFLTCSIVLGQVAVSCMAGYAFSKFHFPFRDAIFFILIILMMMPYQVTLVSNFIVLDQMKLIGSYAAVILPGIFSPFGVFLMRQVIDTMPNETIEAAKLDGANQFQILTRIVIPRSKSGIVSLIILSFVDNWNMVEQPLIFLKDRSAYPLSIFLSQINSADPSLGFACGMLAMIPVALLFVFFEQELVEGITLSNFR